MGMRFSKLWPRVPKAARPEVSPASSILHSVLTTQMMHPSHSQYKTDSLLYSRHKKYHRRPFKCSIPSCKARNVGFSLEKDLVRHQSSHEGERYFCPHIGCFAV